MSAQHLIDQARQHHANFRARQEWRRAWRRGQRAWQRHWRRPWEQHLDEKIRAATAATTPPPMSYGSYGTQTVLGLTLPIFAVLHAAVFVACICALLSLLSTGAIFGWPLPSQLPVWASILILVWIYFMVTAPLRATRLMGHHWGGAHVGPWTALHGIFWLSFTVLFFWLAYHHIPEVHALIDSLPKIWPRSQGSFNVESFV